MESAYKSFEVDPGRYFRENNSTKLGCLDALPLPVVILYTGQNEIPEDYLIVYANQAMAEMEKIPVNKLDGSYYFKDIFPNWDKNSLKLYWETGMQGKVHRFSYFSPEGDRYLEIMCYQPLPGYCACILEDVSEKMRLSRELADARHCIDLALENTLDYMCFYDARDNSLRGEQNTLLRLPHMPSQFTNVPQALADRGVLRSSSLPDAEAMFQSLAQGNEDASAELELNLSENGEKYQWYKMTSVTYASPLKNEKRILIMVRNIHDEVLYRKKIENEAQVDPLTQIYNRRAGEKAISLVPIENRVRALFLFDLDNFKGINDTYGHQAGDEALRLFGKILKSAFRETDILFRLGGDEFAAFATGKETGFVEQIALRILSALVEQKDVPFPVRASIGVGVTTSDAYTYEELYESADKALYEAKNAGKNIWRMDVLPDKKQ